MLQMKMTKPYSETMEATMVFLSGMELPLHIGFRSELIKMDRKHVKELMLLLLL